MFTVRDYQITIPLSVWNTKNQPEALFPKEFYKSSYSDHINLYVILNGEWTALWKFLKNFYHSFFGLPQLNAVKTSYAPLRKTASHTSEMLSQLLKGEKFYFIYSLDNFDFGYTEDGYFGYVSSHQLQSYENDLFRDFTLNSRYPIGSKVLKQPQSIDLDKLINDLYDTPYLWGGRSNWGIDCSGLTQLLMLAKNILLPRDAYQQADFGELIPFGQHRFGDLVFFGKNHSSITHVGFILDSDTILHAYGFVRKDRLVEKGIYHIDYNQITHELQFIKRYPDHFNFLHILQY